MSGIAHSDNPLSGSMSPAMFERVHALVNEAAAASGVMNGMATSYRRADKAPELVSMLLHHAGALQDCISELLDGLVTEGRARL